MSTTGSATVLRGYIAPLPAGQPCRVALVCDDTEYPVLPRGAGIDLADMVSAQVEVRCTLLEEQNGEESQRRLHVRSYTVLDGQDDAWFGDE